MTNEIVSSIDQMEGHSFEYFCAALLKKSGYHSVSVTKGSGDFGVDVIAYRHSKKYVIQCKNYKGNVGNKAVQEIFSGKTCYKADVAVVLTNSYFTKAAKETAAMTGVVLWDRTVLNKMMEKAFPTAHSLKKAKKGNVIRRITAKDIFEGIGFAAVIAAMIAIGKMLS